MIKEVCKYKNETIGILNESTIEHEPLGQKVLQDDPADIPTPPPNESVSFWADMEWQCEAGEEFYGGFSGMPFHCQQNVLEGGSGYWDMLFREEEDPSRIGHEGLGHGQSPTGSGITGDGKEATGEQLLSAFLDSTSKPTDKDGDGVIDFEQDYDENGNVSFGASAGVAVNAFDDSIPDFQDASQSEDDGKLNKREVKKIADDLLSMFDANPNCLSYISDLLDKVETPFNPIVSKNPLDVLWAVFAQDGIFIRDPKSEFAGGNATGSIAKTPNWFFEMRFGVKVNSTEHKPAGINIRPDNRIYTNSVWKKGSKSAKIAEQQFNRSKELKLASKVLGEVLHHSGAFVYTDREFSVALAELHNIPLPNCNSVNCWSRFWHTRFGTIRGENGNTVFCQFTNVK